MLILGSEQLCVSMMKIKINNVLFKKELYYATVPQSFPLNKLTDHCYPVGRYWMNKSQNKCSDE